MSAVELNVADIYELSPLQAEVLGEALHPAAGAAPLVEQAVYLIDLLDVTTFRRAWHQVVARHPAPRSSLHWEGLDRPVQVVHRTVALPFDEHDWRGTAPAERQQRLRTYLQMDRRRPFHLGEAPLMRFGLIRLGEQSYQLVWTCSRAVLDGWSRALLLDEVLDCYRALRRGEEFGRPPAPAYRDYVSWVQHQATDRAAAFWRQDLTEMADPTPLPLGKPGDGSDRWALRGEARLPLGADLMARLGMTARRYRLSQNTLIWAAWALVLGQHAGRAGVRFGTTVPGRPEAVSGSDAMVGRFANVVPVRIALPAGDDLLPWLVGLEAEQAEQRPFTCYPPAQLRAWGGVPDRQPLFESLLALEHRPPEKSPTGSDGLLRGRVALVEAVGVGCPLVILLQPGGQGWAVKANFAADRLDPAAANRLLESFQAMLARVAGAGSRRPDPTPTTVEPASPLVPIQAGGQGTPLFLVHPAGGDVGCYAPLAGHLGPDRPVLALKARGDDAALHGNVEALAAHYVAALRAARPEGPFLLGGWSVGALVAYEMTRLLAAQGDSVPLLTLIDPTAAGSPSGRKARSPLLLFATHLGLPIRRSDLAALPRPQRLHYLFQAARKAGALPPETTPVEFRRHLRLFTAHVHAASKYTPLPYSGRILLLQSAKGSPKRGDELRARWAPLVGAMEFQVVPGSHLTMMREPHVRTVADLLRTRS
jgi:thioesterase domain-containing protein